MPLAEAMRMNQANGSQPAPGLLRDLLHSLLIPDEEWANLPPATKLALEKCHDPTALLELLVGEGLLTNYQASRIGAGKIFGLILGNYRVTERIGAGGMGIVFKAQHVRMRRPVAIKVLPVTQEADHQLLMRFYSEMRVVAQLQHPNIVSAIDAGEVANPDPDGPVLHYFAMEYVHGKDLEENVIQDGALSIARACDLAFQVASALTEAHKQDLVHRDIKPSNVLVTPEWQAKLLDFGLARHFRHRMTEPGTVLGTVDYIAPEQARDSSTVDIRADIYGLGGTLFWALAARTPFPAGTSITRDLAARLTQPAPSIRTVRPDVPAELEAVIGKMMALHPDDRYPDPSEVMRALLRFIKEDSRDLRGLREPDRASPAAGLNAADGQDLQGRIDLAAKLDDCERERDQAREALPAALTSLLKHCATETAGHLKRIRRYCRCLAEEAARLPAFAASIDRSFVQALETLAPLHDLGNLAVPQYILKKPGRLTPEERILMQEHSTIGAAVLEDVAAHHASGLPHLAMAIAIVRHHHERFDGTGYPDRLVGTAIPLAARIVILADVYDALRTRQVYKPALSHCTTCHIITQGSDGFFDPNLLPAFVACALRFEAIHREFVD